MKSVYISGPLRAETPHGIASNVRRARDQAEFFWKQGFAVLCPHLNTLDMVGMLNDDSRFLEGDLLLMRGVDIIVMLRRWTSSEGCLKEYSEAFDLGMTCLFQDDDEYEHFRYTPTKRGDTHFEPLPLTWDKLDIQTFAGITSGVR